MNADTLLKAFDSMRRFVPMVAFGTSPLSMAYRRSSAFIGGFKAFLPE